MTKKESLQLLDDLNKIISGNKHIINQIDSGVSVNIDKCMKVSLTNAIKLSVIIKEVIDSVVVSDYNGFNPFDILGRKK